MKTIKTYESSDSMNMNSTFIFLTFLIIGCSDPQGPVKPVISEPGKVNTLDINFYIPSENVAEKDVPQITLKSNNVQITGIGNNSNGIQGDIKKMYISDTQTQTEWIVLLDETGPEFLYAINSATREKLSFLCWLDREDNSKYTLRVYDYDWISRLGTLQYEAVVNGDKASVVFENEAAPKNSRTSRESSKGLKPTSSSETIIELEKYRFESTSKNEDSVIHDGVLDKQFRIQIKVLIEFIHQTKAKLFEAPCNVSKILNRSDQNLVCKLSDQINTIARDDILNGLSQAADETAISDTLELNGSSTKVNVDFFRHSEVVKFIDRHLNNVRSIFSHYFDFEEWAASLREFNNIRSEDLDHLSGTNGVLQISLSWNSSSDLDLRVTDPFGEEIDSQNPSSASGGFLDLEDTDGFGPENIFWIENIPDGTYRISVVYQDGVFGPRTEYTVKVVNGLGVERDFSGSVGFFDRKVLVGSFTKRGKEIL